MSSKTLLVPLTLAALLTAACGERGPLVTVTVEGGDEAIRALRVNTSLDGVAGTARTLTTDLRRFALRLPAGAAGTLVVDIEAEGGDGCLRGAGRGEALVSQSRPVELPVALAPVQGCSVLAERVGEPGGVIRSAPEGILCGELCSASFPLDSELRLLTGGDLMSYFARWSGDCEGTGDCLLRVGPGRSRAVGHFLPRVQAASNWYWDNPLPVGAHLLRVSGSGPDDVWAAGEAGVVLHFDGADWRAVASGTSCTFRALFASGPGDIYFGCEAGLYRWDGVAMRPVDGREGGVWDIWGSAATDLWTVGGTGVVSRRRGGAWSAMDTGVPAKIFTLWGSGPDDVWFAGSRSADEKDVIIHWDGRRFAVASEGSRIYPRRLLGSGSKDVWLVGDNDVGRTGEVMHWDGEGWTFAATGGVHVIGGWAGGAGLPVGGRSALFAAGEGGVTRRVEGGELVDAEEGGGRTGWIVEDLWGSGADDVWAVGRGGLLLRWNGRAWSSQNSGPQVGAPAFLAGCSASPREAWVVGEQGSVLRWDGGAWRAVASGTRADLRAVLCPAPGEIWAVGSDGAIIHHVDGQTKTLASHVSHMLNAVHGAGDDIWAVGYGGAILRGSAAGFTVMATGLDLWWGVQRFGPKDVWIVGRGSDEKLGKYLRWDGASFRATVRPEAASLFSIRGHGSTDLWLGGTAATGGTLVLRDGGAGLVVDYRGGAGGVIAFADRGGELWAVTTQILLRRLGGTWMPAATGAVKENLAYRGLFSGPRGDLWIVGTDSRVLHSPP